MVLLLLRPDLLQAVIRPAAPPVVLMANWGYLAHTRRNKKRYFTEY